MPLLRAALLASVAVFLASPAAAACYETLGCSDKDAFQPRHLREMSCERLGQIPSDIYGENGFCWKVWTAANSNCRYTKRAAVPLSKTNPALFARLEAAKRQLGSKRS